MKSGAADTVCRLLDKACEIVGGWPAPDPLCSQHTFSPACRLLPAGRPSPLTTLSPFAMSR
jgi:hypothetical protein